MARAIRLTFEIDVLPAIGLVTYAWIPAHVNHLENAATSLVTGERTIENGNLRLTVEADGGMTLLDKRSGQTFTDLGHYEDVGDVGNEYIFRQPDGDIPITTKGGSAHVRIIEDKPYRATLEIVQRIEIPESADPRLEQEVNTMVSILDRKSGRSANKVPLTLVTRVGLERLGKGVRVSVAFDNPAKDHRLRVLFPTDVRAATHYADSIFEVAERQNEPSVEWQNPSNCQHMQAFVDIHEDKRGLTIRGDRSSFGRRAWRLGCLSDAGSAMPR
jgi:alpha-mannosidase